MLSRSNKSQLEPIGASCVKYTTTSEYLYKRILLRSMATDVVVVQPNSIDAAIDRGGTFTDVWARAPGRGETVIKLLPVNPETYEDAPTEGKKSNA